MSSKTKSSSNAIGQLMLDIEGLELSQEDRELLCHPQVGGVILFSRNYQNVTQLQKLVTEIKSLRFPALLIAVDQEGGRVQRLREGFTRLPSMQWLGQHYELNPNLGLDLAYTSGWLMATEVLATGIDFSFAPVLDVDSGISTIIGDRSFSSDPIIVAKLGQAFSKGMKAAGMSAIGKHFPGHGSVALDSHYALPVDTRDFQQIDEHDLVPFRELIISADLDGIMPAHIVYSAVDVLPAGFSKYWLQTILRKQLNFKGAIFSDDLSMAGANVLGDYQQRARAATDAGCDMILVCNQRQAAIEVLECLGTTVNENASQRLQTLYGNKNITGQELNKDKLWQDAVKKLNSIYVEE